MEAAVNALRRFCMSIGRDADFEKLNRRQLNDLLCLFYADVQKCRQNRSNSRSGTNYSKNTINAHRYGLYKYISSINSRIDIIHDPEFEKAENSFKGRLDALDKKETSISQVISLKDVKRLYLMTATFEISNPVGLQSKVFFEVLLYLCHGNKMHISLVDMQQDSFRIKTDNHGKRYVALIGKDKSTPEADRMYENTENSLCPLASFQKYMSRLNPLCNSFWQQPRKIVDSDQLVWYDSTPLGASVLNGMVCEISRNAHLSKVYSNDDIIATSPSFVKNETFKKKEEDSDSNAEDAESSSSDGASLTSATSMKNKHTHSHSIPPSTSMPGFFPGTTWPVDATLELLINYEAVKEVRTVKKQFYPLIYHLTRTDYDSIAKSMSSIKPLMELLKTRYTPTKVTAVESTSKSETILDGRPTRQANRIRQDTTIITDIEEAKREVLKLFSRMDLKRQDFAKMLCWIQKLEIKVGRSGDQYISDKTDEKTPSKVKPKVSIKNRLRSNLPSYEPPKVSTRLRSGSAAPTTNSKKVETRKTPATRTSPVTRSSDKSLSNKNKSTNDKNKSAAPLKVRFQNERKSKSTPVGRGQKKGNDKAKQNSKKLEIRKPKGLQKRAVSPDTDSESSETDSSSETDKVKNSKKKSSDVDIENEFVPNKRLRMEEQSEQNEVEELYTTDIQPVPMCLYKVEEEDDEEPMIIESQTWFPPPQVEIENLEGIVKKEQLDDEDEGVRQIKQEIIEKIEKTREILSAIPTSSMGIGEFPSQVPTSGMGIGEFSSQVPMANLSSVTNPGIGIGQFSNVGSINTFASLPNTGVQIGQFPNVGPIDTLVSLPNSGVGISQFPNVGTVDTDIGAFPSSDSVIATTASMFSQQPVAVGLNMPQSNVHLSPAVPLNEGLMNSSAKTSDPESLNIVSVTSGAANSSLNSYQEPVDNLHTSSSSETVQPKKSNRTCLGDVCLGDDCPHEHILVAKSKPSTSEPSNKDSFSISRNSDKDSNESIDILSDDEENEQMGINSEKISSNNSVSDSNTRCRSPESAVMQSDNQVSSVNDMDQLQPIEGYTVKLEVNTFPEFDDGKEADPIIIIDDD